MRQQSILVVCWDFPPHNGIGGRRWAKISKSLLKLGHSVSVIACTADTDQQKSRWISPEELLKIKLYFCPKNLLVKWLNDYDSAFSFVKIRLAKFLLTLFYRGTIYDKAIGVRKQFLEVAREVIIKENIDIIFVTGTPFNLLYYTAILKKEFAKVKIVADYRDPWINAQNYGMSTLSPARKTFELKKQNYVFEHVDYVCAPNGVLLEEIRSTYNGVNGIVAKFIELPHAFDPDDVIKENDEKNTSSGIKIMYAGTLYLGIEKYLKFLDDALNYIEEKTDQNPVELSFYTYQKEQGPIFKGKERYVKFSESIGDQVFQEARSSDFILILLAEHNKNYVTSKFFEFLPYQKPYLYVGPAGVVSEKIVSEGLGYYLKNREDLYNIISEKKWLKPSIDTIEKNSFESLTKNLLQAISDN